jgi:hypothetical protein
MSDLTDETTEIAEDIPADDVEAEVEAEAVDADAEGDEQFTVTIKGEEPEDEDGGESETPVIRTLRQKLREAERKAKALEREKTEASAAKQSAELPPRPKLEDFDYDDAKFAEGLESWIDQKKAHDATKKAEQDERTATQREFEERQTGYNTRKVALGAADFDDAEATVDEVLSVHQRGMLIDAAERPELIVYALGTKPKLAAQLAAIKNPVRFIAEIVRLEGKLEVSTTRKPPAPEKRLATTGGAVTGTNQQVAKLKAAAEASGDYTAYFAAKRKAENKE